MRGGPSARPSLAGRGSEVLLMLERAGFTDVEMHGEHAHRPPTSDDGAS